MNPLQTNQMQPKYAINATNQCKQAQICNQCRAGGRTEPMPGGERAGGTNGGGRAGRFRSAWNLAILQNTTAVWNACNCSLWSMCGVSLFSVSHLRVVWCSWIGPTSWGRQLTTRASYEGRRSQSLIMRRTLTQVLYVICLGEGLDIGSPGNTQCHIYLRLF